MVRRFTTEAVEVLGGTSSNGTTTILDGSEMPEAAREAALLPTRLEVSFDDPAPRGSVRVTRSHPVVTGLATYVLESALDPPTNGGAARSPARRCGVIRTSTVSERSTLLLLRLRFHLLVRRGRGPEDRLLAEDSITVGFRGSPADPSWLTDAEIEALVAATPDANTEPSLATKSVQGVLDSMAELRPHLDRFARERGEALLEAHQRVRQAAGSGTRSVRVEPNLPADVLGVFVYLPRPGGSA